MFFVLRGSIFLLVSSFTPIGCCLITACTKTTCTFQEFTLRHDFIKMLSKDEKKFEISIHSPYDIATDFTEISAGNRYLMCADCRQEQTRNKPHAVHTYQYSANYRIHPPNLRYLFRVSPNRVVTSQAVLDMGFEKRRCRSREETYVSFLVALL